MYMYFISLLSVICCSLIMDLLQFVSQHSGSNQSSRQCLCFLNHNAMPNSVKGIFFLLTFPFVQVSLKSCKCCNIQIVYIWLSPLCNDTNWNLICMWKRTNSRLFSQTWLNSLINNGGNWQLDLICFRFLPVWSPR